MVSLSYGKKKSLNKQNYSSVWWARIKFNMKKSHIFRVVEFLDQTTIMEQTNTGEGYWFIEQRGGEALLYSRTLCISDWPQTHYVTLNF